MESQKIKDVEGRGSGRKETFAGKPWDFENPACLIGLASGNIIGIIINLCQSKLFHTERS